MSYFRDRIVRQHLRDRFLLTLTDGSAIEGLLIDADATTIILADCNAVTPSAKTSVDGQVFIPRANVLYMQRP